MLNGVHILCNLIALLHYIIQLQQCHQNVIFKNTATDSRDVLYTKQSNETLQISSNKPR